MKFPQPLIRGTLLKRYKRFLADVELESGETITAHCANPGAMLGLKQPGATIWLSPAQNPKRKLKYSWELIEIPRGKTTSYVGINTSHPNKLVEEAIIDGTITELKGYDHLKREVKYGSNSRIDILLRDQNSKDPRPDCYVEVKNVHLKRKTGLAEFPDSVTARGAKHLNELSNMAASGARAVMVYLIQRSDIGKFAIASDIDPTYAAAFKDAQSNNVEMLAYKCQLTPQVITVKKQVEIII